MGALFNTPGTAAILQLLSQAYQGDNFVSLSNDPAHISDLDPNTTTLPATHDFCKKYRLVPGDKNHNAHWKKWLSYFDQHGGGPARKAMADALRNPGKYTAIEFFAVPANKADFKVSTADWQDLQTNTYALVVTAQTPTYDQL